MQGVILITERTCSDALPLSHNTFVVQILANEFRAHDKSYLYALPTSRAPRALHVCDAVDENLLGDSITCEI